VAEEMGAERIFGMDINPEHVTTTNRRLQTARNIQALREKET